MFAHATGRWAKKIRGKLHYFGPWRDPDAALQRYLDQRDDLHAGRTPRVQGDGLTVKDLVNRFLTTKRHLADAGEITERTFSDYHATCALVTTQFGLSRLVSDLASDDFEQLRASFSDKNGPVTIGNLVNRVRVLFKYGYDAGLIAQPMRYGPSFKRPSKKTLRKARHDKGPRMFDTADLRKALQAAPPQMNAMMLLGINCGYGNTDVAMLPITAIDFKTGWAVYPRPKTGIPRRCPLWPETIAAIKAAMIKRPEPKETKHAALMFITKYGGAWAKDTRDNPVSVECTRLLKEVGIHRKGLSFYALRHTFETVGGESRDQIAVDAVMGHVAADSDMSAVYRERISDERLIAVTDHVRRWLFAKPVNSKRSSTAKKAARPGGNAPAVAMRKAR